MTRLRFLLAVAALLAVTSCDTMEKPLLEPDATRPLIQDGRDGHAGSGVFLLPPINDTDYSRTAPFDLEANPRVEICHLDVQEPLTEESVRLAECDNLVAWWETDDSHDGETFVTVQPQPGEPATSDSLYSVNWKTPGDSADVAFRGTVLLPVFTFDGSTIVVEYERAARFDVVLYDNSSTKLDPDSVVGFTAGKNFPIKFIVEETAGCDGLDCFAFEVTCEGGVFQTDHAGVSMPEDWATECDTSVDGPERSWWLVQERLPEGSECVPDGENGVDGVPYEPCYVWQLLEEDADGGFEKYIQEFAQEVTVQFCNNPVEDGGVPEPLERLAAVFRYSDPPGEVALVPDAEENALAEYTCPYDGQGSTSSASLGLRDSTHGIVGSMLALFGLEPRSLYAGDTGTLSATTIRMSDFQRFVEFNELEATSTLSSALVLGESEEIGVRLTSPPHSDPLDGPSAGVPGQDVRFEVTSGEADLSASDAVACTDGSGAVIPDCILVPTTTDDEGTTTDEAGYASVTVTAGQNTGTIEVTVTVPAEPDLAALTFTTEAVDLMATFLEPLETGDFSGNPDELFSPTVYICEGETASCDAQTAHLVIPTSEIKLVEENGRKFYQTDWKPKNSDATIGVRYRAQVRADGITVGYSIPIEVTKGGKSERVEDVYYNGENSTVPLKFTITRAGT